MVARRTVKRLRAGSRLVIPAARPYPPLIERDLYKPTPQHKAKEGTYLPPPEYSLGCKTRAKGSPGYPGIPSADA
jgi:hypothetical protein